MAKMVKAGGLGELGSYFQCGSSMGTGTFSMGTGTFSLGTGTEPAQPNMGTGSFRVGQKPIRGAFSQCFGSLGD